MPLYSCKYCGRIHPKNFDCGRKPKHGSVTDTEERRFRSSAKWTKMSSSIRERDHYMCVYCKQQEDRITRAEIEVHHIIPVSEDYGLRLDSENLISLCREHHEQAEQGKIKRSVLQSMAARQEEKWMEDYTPVL